MQKIFLLLLFFIFPTLLLSQNYCMYIDQFDLTINNKSKIHTILEDIAYPSTKIVGNQILIYSGKFKNYDNASKLLMLTKSRYKNAKVASCEGASLYRGTPIFKNDSPRKRETIIVAPLRVKENQEYYCLKVFESSLSQSAKQKSKINYILNRLPETKSKLKDDRFIIYSGNFSSKESAQTIAKILRREFPDTKVQTCKLDKKSSPIVSKKMPTKHGKISQGVLEQTEFTINSLDTKGYISVEIASNKEERLHKNGLDKSDIRHALDTQREEHFNGLYLKTNTAYDVQNSDAAYDVRLEFDLFNQGYYENKKKNEKNRIKNQINFYRTVKNIEILKKEQELLRLKKYKNSVNVSTLLLKLRVNEVNLHNAKLKLQNGLLIEYEYDEYRLALQKVKDELLLFKNMTLLKIPKDLWQLLNQIEHTQLISEKKLIRALKEESIDLKLVQTLKDQKPLAEEWSDKLRVNFYAGVRKMYLAQNQTLIGIEAKIPLSNYAQTAELDTIQNKIMSQQVRLQHTQSEEILKDAMASYKYKQQKLKTYSFELARIKKHMQDLMTINNSAFAAYANLSFSSTQKAETNYLDKYTQAQLARLATYEELINIMYLIHTSDIQDILQYGVYR